MKREEAASATVAAHKRAAQRRYARGLTEFSASFFPADLQFYRLRKGLALFII